MKGIIALDIDGTVTLPGQNIPRETLAFLSELIKSHWDIIFITGRSVPWASKTLQELPSPYYLSVQNGAITLEMPSKKILSKKYLDRSIIPVMQEICEGEPTDFIIYSGYEFDDFCFYRPNHFSPELLGYLHARASAYQEKWEQLSSFNLLTIEQFPSIKCFGLHSPAQEVAKRIERDLGLHVPVIRDPFNDNYFVAQATHPDVSKGQALNELAKLLGNTGPVIAAGDDYNDISMLAEADLTIVMATAPETMLSTADIIAPSAQHQGLINGLTQAIKRYAG